MSAPERIFILDPERLLLLDSIAGIVGRERGATEDTEYIRADLFEQMQRERDEARAKAAKWQQTAEHWLKKAHRQPPMD